MWDSKDIDQDDNTLKITYHFVVPVTLCEKTHQLKPWKAAVLAKRFFGQPVSSTNSFGDSWKYDKGDHFDHVSQGIRSFNKKIAQKFGFNINEKGYKSLKKVEASEKTASTELWSLVENKEMTFGSTQWENSLSDMFVA